MNTAGISIVSARAGFPVLRGESLQETAVRGEGKPDAPVCWRLTEVDRKLTRKTR
jgi:hypothetical protein